MNVLIMNALPITFSVWLFIDLFYYYNLKIKVSSFLGNLDSQNRTFLYKHGTSSRKVFYGGRLKYFLDKKTKKLPSLHFISKQNSFCGFSACRGSPKINDTKITWQSCSRHKICALLVDKVSLLQNVYAKLIFFKFI